MKIRMKIMSCRTVCIYIQPIKTFKKGDYMHVTILGKMEHLTYDVHFENGPKYLLRAEGRFLGQVIEHITQYGSSPAL